MDIALAIFLLALAAYLGYALKILLFGRKG